MPSISLLTAGTTIWRSGLPPFFSTPSPPSPLPRTPYPSTLSGSWDLRPPQPPAAPLSALFLSLLLLLSRQLQYSMPVQRMMTRSIDPSAATAAMAYTFTACPMTTTRPSPSNDILELLAAAAAGPGGPPSYLYPPSPWTASAAMRSSPRVSQRPEEVLAVPGYVECAKGDGVKLKDLLTTMPELELKPSPGSSGSAETTVRRTWVGMALILQGVHQCEVPLGGRLDG
jgi:hypothetical protein